MELATFDPFTMLRDLDRWFERPTATGWAPRLDAFDRDNALVVRLEIPGIDPDDIDITVEDHTLTISGVRTFEEETSDKGFHRREILQGSFKRSVVLPDGFDADEITAKATNGMLEISIPKSPAVLPRKVKVELD
jgi:HSP20 family protein